MDKCRIHIFETGVPRAPRSFPATTENIDVVAQEVVLLLQAELKKAGVMPAAQAELQELADSIKAGTFDWHRDSGTWFEAGIYALDTTYP